MAATRATVNFLLRTPSELHRRLKRESVRRGVSLNALCVSILGSAVSPATAPEPTPWAPWVDKARVLYGDALRGVVLFGSVARGEETEGSDADLLLVLADDTPIARALYRRWDDADPTDDRVTPHFAHLPRRSTSVGSLWIEVALDGRILYDLSGALAGTLSSIRRDLATGRIRSGTAHGQRYWIHPDPEAADA